MIWPWTKLDKPLSLPSRCWVNVKGEYCWDDWKRDTKAKYPVRYFLQEDLPRIFRRMWRHFPNAAYWLRTHTYNRYHILDMRCPGYGFDYEWGWIDRCEAVFIAPFKLLQDFMEKEFPGHCDWEAEPVHAAAAKEFKELYDWWMVGRMKAWDERLSKAKEMRVRDPDFRLTDEYKTYIAEGEVLEAQDDIMLLRLIKVRHFMWT